LLRLGTRIDDRTPILTDGFGDALKPAYMSATFRTFARSHGLDVTYHSLRHTASSLMLASGIDVRTVAGRLGHASAQTTLATYAHLIGQADRDAAERLEALLSRSPRLAGGTSPLVSASTRLVLHLLTRRGRHIG